MTFKCDQCAIPEGETTCVACGAEAVEIVRVDPFEVDLRSRMKEGVEVEAVPCGVCGEMTIGRIENSVGQVGCLKCFGSFLQGIRLPKLPGSV
jgi:transcription elongation factor Elf1